MKPTFEIRSVDAYCMDDEWIYNQTFHFCYFKSIANNMNQRIRNAIKAHGVSFIPHSTAIQYDGNGDCWEVLERKTMRPIFQIVEVEQKT